MRKFLALVLSLILSVGAVTTVASAAKFTDVPASDETLTKAVDLLSSVGITTGTTETTFGTSESVTRQQMATFIYRLMKAGKTVEGKEGDNSTSFTDLDDPFYYFMISWANDMGIIKGKSATSFDPKGQIILQDAYTMLVRALHYEDKEALAYPFDYIRIAEDIGLDEGLPANVNYDTALTRGNVAILLYNAFYADMATGETAYEIEFEEVELSSGKLQIVEKGQTPYTVYDTVAEDIFGIKKTVQRIVATPNYSLDGNSSTASDKNDLEIVTLECFDEDYAETDSDLFSDVAFEEFGLSGKADDYFLIDLSIYYKKDEGEEPEIIAASALGNVKKDIAGSKVKFERTTGSGRHKYMVTSATQNLEQRFRAFTGKVTVDGVTSYLFDAPWSYSKPANVLDKDNECITLLWLDATERDPDDEEYVPDFNFKSDRDVLGRGADYYKSLTRTTYYDSGKTESYLLGKKDLRGVGLYTSWGFYTSMIIDPHNEGNLFETDAWDSNGDGKIDYMWIKPYTVGQVDEDDGESFMDMHNTANAMDKYGCIYNSCDVPTIYTYGANKQGADFKDGQIFIGYINAPANYIKCSSVEELKYETQTFTGKRSSDGNNVAINGTYGGRWGASLRYIGFPGGNGERPSESVLENSQLTSSGPFVSIYFKDANLGQDFNIAYVSGLMFHVKPTSGTLSIEDYALIFPNTRGSYAYTTTVGVVTDGNLQETGNFLEVLIDGELASVAVKPQTSQAVADDNLVEIDGEQISLKPVTKKQPNGVYDFSAYVGKLLTYSKNSDDEYSFKIAPVDAYGDKSVLKSDDPEAYYTYQSDEDGKTTSAFVNSTNNLYQFVKKNSSTVHDVVAPSKFVTFGKNAKVVIKTYEDDEEVFTIYDSDNMPEFGSSVEFKNIKYIVKNNPKSTSIEELVYLYAEAADGKTVGEIGKLKYRIVKSSKVVRDDEGAKVVYYDVYNPFTGKIEEEYETETESERPIAEIGGIYTLTDGGYIADENLLGMITEYGEVATSDTTEDDSGLGLVEIGDFDKEIGLLSIEGEELLYAVDDDTVITFLNFTEETIEIKDEKILYSTSKAYRCNEDKEMPLLAFVVSSEIKKEDEYEHADIIVIVRYDDIDLM